jgi:putative SOS response-associated peptidase YedK
VPANPLMATIHNTKMRMPALLSDEHTKPWLDTTLPESQVMELLRPFPEEELLAYPIQPFLGSKSNDRFDVITKPLNDTPRNPQLGLF